MKEISMERVVNSVRQICSACDELLQVADGTDSTVIKNMCNLLIDKKSNLEYLYNNTPGNDLGIAKAKADLELQALKLEFHVAHKYGTLIERYNMRKRAEIVYATIRERFLNTDKDNADELSRLGEIALWALKFLSRSQHIIFETTDEDMKYIMIVEDML